MEIEVYTDHSLAGAQITMEYDGRTLLGDVRGAYHTSDGEHLSVKYFNGEYWPVDPKASDVCVLERTYEATDTMAR